MKPKKPAPLQLVKPSPKRPRPVEYFYNPVDLEEFGDRFYRFPRKLVEDGTCARIWGDGSERGRPAASSLILPLALFAWMNPKEPEARFTPWVSLSYRRLAALAGVNKGSVKTGLAALEEQGLLETRMGQQHPRDGGHSRLEYRLARRMFPEFKRSPFFSLSGALAFGGMLAMLPRSSARHLFLVIAALDPVFDEDTLGELIKSDPEQRLEPVSATIARRRRGCPSTLTHLKRVSGMTSPTLHEAIAILSTPFVGQPLQPLILKADGDKGRFYYVNKPALEHYFEPEVMNDKSEIRAFRDAYWGRVLKRAA